MNADAYSRFITIIGADADIVALKTALSRESIEVATTALPALDTVSPITFESVTAVSLVLGSGGIIGKCIIAYLRERKRKIKVHLRDGSLKVISENVTPEEMSIILESLQGSAPAIIMGDEPIAKIAQESDPERTCGPRKISDN